MESTDQGIGGIPGCRDRDEKSTVGIVCIDPIFFLVTQVEAPHTARAHALLAAAAADTPLLVQRPFLFQSGRARRGYGARVGGLRGGSLKAGAGRAVDRGTLAGGIEFLAESAIMAERRRIGNVVA